MTPVSGLSPFPPPEARALLEAARPAPASDAAEQWKRLPGVVGRYLRAAGVAEAPVPRTVFLRQRGRFRLQQKWLPFSARQWFSIDPPGFVWRAHVRLAPLVGFSVTDSLAGGRGRMRARLLTFFSVADAAGTEVNQGALTRYLAETAWFPFAWLSPSVTWQEKDARAAQATLRVGEQSVSALFHFGADGRPATVSAQRYMAEVGKFSLYDWSGDFSDYRRAGGVLIPHQVRVQWHLPSGEMEYFRGEITEAKFGV